MPATVHVFVSSTWLDLGPERKKVEEVLANFRETKFIGMEYFGSRDETTSQASLDEVDRSQLYIGIVAGRYGSGITRQEYDRAHERGLPCFIYLKDDAAIEPSGRDADPAAGTALAQFKTDLRGRHLIRARFANPDQLATFVATDLHRWLFDQYLEPLLRSAAEDEPSRATASRLLAEIKDLTAISALTRRTLQAAQLIASVDRAAALARYGFRDDIYDFRSLIEAETRWYVGRIEIFEKLRSFGANPRASGYFCIVADAGLGKTALAAEIAGRFDAPAFFCSTAEGRTTAHQCLRHLCAELILRYGLQHDHIPDSAGKDPNFLVKLLGEAVAKARAGVWMVVDGLDEADDPERGRNPLLLPASLPANAYVVITQRPTQWRVATQASTRFVEHAIRGDDPAQAADIEAHLHRQAERPEIGAALRNGVPPITTQTFVAALQNASQGNFKYLDYVLADILEGEPGYRPLDVSKLPKGLERYYDQFWARMGMDRMIEQAWDDWHELFRPVVALVGIAAEPVTVDWIATHAGRDTAEVRARVLVPWQRFLTTRNRGAASETWHIVHKSFADFLRARPELELETFNARVADYYLADPAHWSRHRGYASRHLAAHLHAAQDSDRLSTLIGRRDWYDAQLAADPGSVLFVEDVNHAWGAAESIDEAAVTGGARAPLLAREAACALTVATVSSLSSNLQPGLLAELVRQNVWAPATALAAVAKNPDLGERSRALAALAPHLPDAASVRQALAMARPLRNWPDRHLPLRPLVARLAVVAGPEEALAEGDNAASDETRAAVLAAAAAHLDDATWPTAFQRLFDIIAAQDERDSGGDQRGRRTTGEWHVDAGVEMLRHLPPELIDAALKIVDERISVQWAQARLAGALALRLAVLGDPRSVERLGKVQNVHARLECYAAALQHLPSAARSDLVRVALDIAVTALKGIPTADGTRALATIAAHAPPELARETLERVLPGVLAGPGLGNGKALGAMVSMLDAGTLRSAIEAVRQWDDGYQQRKALTALAQRTLDLSGPERALALISSIGDSHDNSEAMVDFLPYLTQKGYVAESLQAVRTIGRDEFRPQALASIAPCLPLSGVDDALAIAERLPERAGWARAVGALSERLAQLGDPVRALGLVRIIRDGTLNLSSLLAAAARAAAAAGESDEALEIAREIEDLDRRALAYELLAPALAPKSLEAACRDMVHAHNASHHTNAWGASFWSLGTESALSQLIPRFAALDASAAVGIAETIEDDVARAGFSARAAAGLRLQECERVQRIAIASLRRALVTNGWRIGWVLDDIAPALSEPALRDALQLVDEQVQASDDERALSTQTLPASAALLLARLARLGHVEEALQRFQSIGALREEPVEFPGFLGALDAERRRPLIDDALAALESTGWDHSRKKGLVSLAPLLRPESMERALAIAQAIGEDTPRAEAAHAIMQRWADIASMDAAFDRAEALQDWAVLAGALAAFGPHLAGARLERAVQATLRLSSGYWSAPTYAAVARRAAECGMQRDALELAVRAGQHGALVIESMAAFLDASGVADILRHLDEHYIGDTGRAFIALAARRAALGDLPGAFTLADSIHDAQNRALALFRAASDTSERGLLPIYRMWQQALHSAASRSREHALEEIAALAPLARRIGISRTLSEVARTSREVMSTWP
jgi:Domain of unknown function (DUF4062)